jgi:hypothetical protein
MYCLEKMTDPANGKYECDDLLAGTSGGTGGTIP